MIFYFRSINIEYFLLFYIILLSIINAVFSKCIFNGRDVTCFGGTWKEDLLPIENNALERLFISRCSKLNARLETINLNFLQNVTKLSSLSMTGCELTIIPTINYQINSIETLDLSHNELYTNIQMPMLEFNIFKQFPNLKIINLSTNKLSYLSKSWFLCPSNIEIIILDGNLIRGLSPSLADCFTRLKQLSLKQNQFQRLRMPSDTSKLSHGGYYKEASGLKLFAEKNNMIRKDGKEKFLKNEDPAQSRHNFIGVIPHFETLECLDLSQNNIHSIDQIPLSNLENLIRLNLSHNLLSSKLSSSFNSNECDFGTAPFYIKGKSGLVELDLSFNKAISRIHNCWTFGLQNLRILKIKNCSISYIHESSFDKMKALTVLDISHNKLNSVPKEITVVAKTLTWLSLANNNISQITSSYLSRLENLMFLNISYNKYQTLTSLSELESESKQSESIDDVKATSRLEELIHLLGHMRDLKEIDLSNNNLVKLSALYDLSSSMKLNGRLQKIDVRGNALLSQFLDFNVNEITTTLTEFLIDDDLILNCDCLIFGFIKWFIEKHIEISLRCSSPAQFAGMSLSNPYLLKALLNNKSCSKLSISTTPKTIYVLKIFSNANISQDLLRSNNYPMRTIQHKSETQKEIDYQRWVTTGENLTLQCDFFSTYRIDFPINIEWQRLKKNPIENTQSKKEIQKNSKSELLDEIKYREKIEYMSFSYDPRIKIVQIGPVNKDVVVDYKTFSKDEHKNDLLRHNNAGYKYVSFLILQPVSFGDVGRYRCFINGLNTVSIYGQNQLLSKEENIKVFTPPRFTSTPTNPMAIIEGETAEITCRAVGYPLPITSLGRIGSKDFPAAKGRRMKMYKDDSSFFITNVRQVDAGNYSCISRNVAGIVFHNFTLKVQMPAIILNKVQPNKTVKIGDALIIRFKINGIPRPSIRWYKDGKIIMENERIRFSTDHLMLIIQSSTFMDAGIYKISVLNALGGNEAYMNVVIINNSRSPIPNSGANVNENVVPPKNINDPTWMPDYWLSGIIIIVILSILLTSILWITIFFCFSKIIGSKKRRLLNLTNSQFINNFNKNMNSSTTSFSNLRLISSSLFKPLNESSIPLSLTTSTLAPYDQDTVEVDTYTDYTRNSSELFSPELFRNLLPLSNNRLLSQPYFSSGLEMTNKSNVSSSKGEPRYGFMDTCDSGIDSSQIYSETFKSSDAPLTLYQCKHKSKHRTNHQKQKKRDSSFNINDKIETDEFKNLELSKMSEVDKRFHLKMCNGNACQERKDRKPSTLSMITDQLHHTH